MTLGLFTHTTFEAAILVLQEGDTLLVVTKGVTGSRRGGTEFGLQGVTRTLRNTTAASASEICQAVLRDAHDFSHNPWSRVLSFFRKKSLRRGRFDGAGTGAPLDCLHCHAWR